MSHLSFQRMPTLACAHIPPPFHRPGAATVGQLGEQRARLQEVSLTVSGFVETLGQAEHEAKKYASGIFDDTAQLVCVVIILLGFSFVGLMGLSEVGEAPDHGELQTSLVTVNDLDLDRGPWHCPPPPGRFGAGDPYPGDP